MSRPSTLSAWLHEPLMFSRPRPAPVGEPILPQDARTAQSQARRARAVGCAAHSSIEPAETAATPARATILYSMAKVSEARAIGYKISALQLAAFDEIRCY